MVLADFFIYSGFTVWLILVSLLSCGLAYSISNRVSLRSPHFLGWIFMALAMLLELGLFYEAFRRPVILPLLTFYTAAWFAPCIVLSLLEYHHPHQFQVYSLVALVYTAFPVAYRLFSLISGTSSLPKGLSSILSSLLIEEVTTAVLLVFALNALGNLFRRHYGRPKEGKTSHSSGFGHLSQDSAHESPDEAKKDGEPTTVNKMRSDKEMLLGAFPVFGLLFSALAYFAFVHARGVLGIPQYVEPSVGFVISVIAAIPFLFYLILVHGKTTGDSASK
jgi:hypothetical protein